MILTFGEAMAEVSSTGAPTSVKLWNVSIEEDESCGLTFESVKSVSISVDSGSTVGQGVNCDASSVDEMSRVISTMTTVGWRVSTDALYLMELLIWGHCILELFAHASATTFRQRIYRVTNGIKTHVFVGGLGRGMRE